jgi:Tfp pilus assembly protein PilP
MHLKRAELFTPLGWDNHVRLAERLEGARDPFWPDIPELKDQVDVEVDPSSVQRQLVVKVHEFVQNLEFTGSITGMASGLAMLEDNAGTGYSVRVGDIIGKPPEYVRVKLITDNRILFEPVLGIPDDEPKDSPRLIKKLRSEQVAGLRGEQ